MGFILFDWLYIVVLTSAVLGRLLHHAETITIEGQSDDIVKMHTAISNR